MTVVRVFGEISDKGRSALAKEIAKSFKRCDAGMREHKEDGNICTMCHNTVVDTENMNICPMCYNKLCM